MNRDLSLYCIEYYLQLSAYSATIILRSFAHKQMFIVASSKEEKLPVFVILEIIQ